MVPTPGGSWTRRHAVAALARVRPNPSFNRTRRRRALSVGLGWRWFASIGGGAGPVNSLR